MKKIQKFESFNLGAGDLAKNFLKDSFVGSDIYDILNENFFHDAPKYMVSSMESAYWSSFISEGIDWRNGDRSNLSLWLYEKK